jgi:AcrR family transcriptional regulator
MDVKETGKYHHGDLRRALLEAAQLAEDEVGPHTISLRALAKKLDVSHAAAYRHFRNKQALLRGVAIEGHQRLAQALVDAGRSGVDPADTLRRCASAYVRFGLENPGVYQVMFSADTQRDSEAKLAADRVLMVTARIIERSAKTGASRPGVPLKQALAAWSMVHGIVDLELRKQLGERSIDEARQQAELLLDTFFFGLLACE